MSRTRSMSGPFSASSVSAILVLAIVVPFVSVICAKTTFAESHDGRSLSYEGEPFHTPRPGTRSTELARRHGLHANTIRQWRDKYAGLETSDLKRLKQLEAESVRKDRVIARLTMEVDAVRELIAKNGWSPRGEKKR